MKDKMGDNAKVQQILLIHQYFGVIPHLIWQIVSTDVPVLKSQMEEIHKELS